MRTTSRQVKTKKARKPLPKNALRAARKLRGLTVNQVEKVTAISRVQLWRYEHGHGEPVVSTALKLARLYRLPVEKLFS